MFSKYSIWNYFVFFILFGVYLVLEFFYFLFIRRGELFYVDKGGFWLVSFGGGRDGVVMFLGGKGIFYSLWVREVFVIELGDYVNLELLFLVI